MTDSKTSNSINIESNIGKKEFQNIGEGFSKIGEEFQDIIRGDSTSGPNLYPVINNDDKIHAKLASNTEANTINVAYISDDEIAPEIDLVDLTVDDNADSNSRGSNEDRDNKNVTTISVSVKTCDNRGRRKLSLLLRRT